MRYREFAIGRSDEDERVLVDALTLGSGWLAVAARVVTADGDAATVLRALTAASAALLLARRVLNGQATDGDDGLVPDATELPDAGAMPEGASLSWRDYLATHALTDAAVRAPLLNAVGSARRAGCILLDDGEVETMRLELVAAVSSLGDARRILA